MKIHLRGFENTPTHTAFGIFIGGQNCGELCMNGPAAIMFRDTVKAGAGLLSPEGTDPIGFETSGRWGVESDEENQERFDLEHSGRQLSDHEMSFVKGEITFEEYQDQ